MVSGMVIPSCRQVARQRRGPKGRFRVSPAPISDTITHTSVRCSTHTRSDTGSISGSGTGSSWMPTPQSRNTRGRDSGRPATRRGTTAAARAPTLIRAKRKSGMVTVPCALAAPRHATVRRESWRRADVPCGSTGSGVRHEALEGHRAQGGGSGPRCGARALTGRDGLGATGRGAGFVGGSPGAGTTPSPPARR
ncbi:hypothetical protein GCM10009601_08200 [Streptomyces thermospinosisporus]|uniref:Uncharacterized protein n=1 Tax=Streptomyces thermospinosisporus TaxID=161482 RepID=A0ABP4JD13_9ACTN